MSKKKHDPLEKKKKKKYTKLQVREIFKVSEIFSKKDQSNILYKEIINYIINKLNALAAEHPNKKVTKTDCAYLFNWGYFPTKLFEEYEETDADVKARLDRIAAKKRRAKEKEAQRIKDAEDYKKKQFEAQLQTITQQAKQLGINIITTKNVVEPINPNTKRNIKV